MNLTNAAVGKTGRLTPIYPLLRALGCELLLQARGQESARINVKAHRDDIALFYFYNFNVVFGHFFASF